MGTASKATQNPGVPEGGTIGEYPERKGKGSIKGKEVTAEVEKQQRGRKGGGILDQHFGVAGRSLVPKGRLLLWQQLSNNSSFTKECPAINIGTQQAYYSWVARITQST